MRQHGEVPGSVPEADSLSVLDVGLELAAQAVRTVSELGRGVWLRTRPAAQAVLNSPVVGPRLQQPATWLSGLAERGSVRRAAIRDELETALDAIVPALAVEVVRRIDVVALSREYVDLDRILLQVDLNAAAARLDVDALIDRIDLVGLAREVLAEIDLPEIIRESTGAVASDAVRGVRMQTISADDAIARAFDRLRLRTQRVPATATTPAPPARAPE
jgi:hypothetical protein